MRRAITLLAIAFLFARCTGGDSRRGAQDGASGTTAPRDESVEQYCRGITDDEIAKVEEGMKDLNREMVVLGGREMEILTCSRARKGLLNRPPPL